MPVTVPEQPDQRRGADADLHDLEVTLERTQSRSCAAARRARGLLRARSAAVTKSISSPIGAPPLLGMVDPAPPGLLRHATGSPCSRSRDATCMPSANIDQRDERDRRSSPSHRRLQISRASPQNDAAAARSCRELRSCAPALSSAAGESRRRSRPRRLAEVLQDRSTSTPRPLSRSRPAVDRRARPRCLRRALRRSRCARVRLTWLTNATPAVSISADDAPRLAREERVQQQRGDRDDQAELGRDQRLGDAAGERLDVARAEHRDQLEGVDDAGHRAEQTEQRRRRGADRDEGQHALQLQPGREDRSYMTSSMSSRGSSRCSTPAASILPTGPARSPASLARELSCVPLADRLEQCVDLPAATARGRRPGRATCRARPAARAPAIAKIGIITGPPFLTCSTKVSWVASILWALPSVGSSGKKPAPRR